MEQTSTTSTGAKQGSYLAQDFIQAREACWIPLQGMRTFVGCGDDRQPTAASAAYLLEQTHDTTVMDPLEGYASIYGGVAGLAKNVLVVGSTQFGDTFIYAVSGFDGVMQLLITNSRNIQTLHSAEGNEQDPRHFSFISTAPVGCAYAAGVGATADLLVGSSSAIRDIARLDQQHVFGSDDHFDDLLGGQQAFLDHATNSQGVGFALGREQYTKYLQQYGERLGLMVLAGSHTSAKTSGVISNFSLEQVGSSHAAHEQDLDFYRLDIAVVVETVLQALSKALTDIDPHYVLSPELLFRAFQLDAVPVRAVLAAHDNDPDLQGKLDPLNLKMGIRGDQFSAMQTLQARQASGTYA